VYEKLLRRIVAQNHWRKKHLSQDNFLMIAAAIVGTLGGLAASFLKVLTHSVADFLQSDFHWEYKYFLFFLFPLIGILLTTLYLKVFIRKRPFYPGIPPLIDSVMHRNSRLDFHNIYSQIISSALTVGMGGSAGLESPSVSSGASIGSNLGRLSGLNYRETTLLLACGGAAGIAGAFNSPFAGMIFAAEVLLPSFSIPAIIPLLIASAFASVVSTLVHSEPLFALVPHAWAMHSFGVYVVFGITAGFYTVYFSWLNEKTHSYFQGLKSIYSKILIGGIGLGVLVSLFPAIYGEGYIAIQELLDKNYTSLLANSFFSKYQNSTWILIIFSILTLLGKTWGCSITMGSGGNGGMFGPSVGVGGLLGFIFAYSLNQTGWVDLNITNFMIIGMAASVSGMMHAPMTGIFLAAEITGGYALIVPLMVASAISFFINKRIRKYSIYTKQMAEHGIIIEKDKIDTRILNNMNVKMLIEKDFVVLKDSELITNRKKDIVQSERQIFPVINSEGIFIGMLSIEELIQHIVSEDTRQLNQKIGDIVQPVTELVTNDTPLKKVIQLMDTKNTRILPVVDFNKRYLGFITKNGIFKKYRKDLTYYDNILQ
jgi:CIC family chloride channel protein